MTEEEKREIQTGALVLMEAGSKIKPMDCAAFSIITFGQGECEEEWRERCTEAMQKFVVFGWSAFHALGGLSTDWDKAAVDIITRLKGGLPKKGAAEAKPVEKEQPVKKAPVKNPAKPRKKKRPPNG